MSVAIPERVRRLVHEHLPSMEHVELLLHFVGIAPDPKSATEAARDLQVDVAATDRRLKDLVASGLITSESQSAGYERFRYQPSGLALRQAVEQLVEAYRSRPVSLIRVVYERPPESAQRFADAFRLRKDPE